VAALLSANEKKLLSAEGITEENLEEIYNAVQSFVEVEDEPDNFDDNEDKLTEDTQE